jgi:hypothetical protein
MMQSKNGTRGLMEVLLIALMVQSAAVADPIIADDFGDGSIDPAIWVTHGYKGGVGGVGAGSWQYAVDEHASPVGYLQARVWGPTSGNTYGAEAWVRTVKDFNDGQQWVINFSWDTTVNYPPHCDGFAVYMSDQDPPDDCHWDWLWGQPPYYPRPGFEFLWRYSTGWAGPSGPHPSFPVQDWSIRIDSDGTASLYQLPNAQGSPFSTVLLNPAKDWHLGFVLNDATSSGYAAGDNAFRLYDFSASVAPEPGTLGLLGMGVLTILSRSRKH